MAASRSRHTRARHNEGMRVRVRYPVASGAVIYKGTLVALLAGYAVPASDAAGRVVVGVAAEGADNTGGGDGALTIDVESGNAWLFAASGIVAADVGKVAYVADDQTVADAVGTAGVVAGVIEELDASGGAWVYVPPINAAILAGASAAIAGYLKQHAISADDIVAGYYDFSFPFTVAGFSATFRSAAGVPLATTDAAAINAGNVRISLAGTGAPALIATDVVAVVATA